MGKALGSLTPAETPLIEAENLFRQAGPPLLTTVEINHVQGFCHLAGNIHPHWAGQRLKGVGKVSMRKRANIAVTL
jgi:hypothetical protein